MDIFYFLSQIDKLCREHKITKAEFYEKADITASAVSQWRKGKTVPAKSTVQRIADIFSVEVSVLTGEQKIPAPTQGEDGIDEAEKNLIDLFRLLPDDLKEDLLVQIEASLKRRGLLP